MIPRTVLVADGDTVAGTAICKKMRDQGYVVAVSCQDEARATVWQEQMEREGYLFFVFGRNGSGMLAYCEMLSEIVSYLGHVDILIHAGNDNIDFFDLSCAFMSNLKKKKPRKSV